MTTLHLFLFARVHCAACGFALADQGADTRLIRAGLKPSARHCARPSWRSSAPGRAAKGRRRKGPLGRQRAASRPGGNPIRNRQGAKAGLRARLPRRKAERDIPGAQAEGNPLAPAFPLRVDAPRGRGATAMCAKAPSCRFRGTIASEQKTAGKQVKHGTLCCTVQKCFRR